MFLLLGSFKCLPTIAEYSMRGVVANRERIPNSPTKINGRIIAHMKQMVLIAAAAASQLLL